MLSASPFTQSIAPSPLSANLKSSDDFVVWNAIPEIKILGEVQKIRVKFRWKITGGGLKGSLRLCVYDGAEEIFSLFQIGPATDQWTEIDKTIDEDNDVLTQPNMAKLAYGNTLRICYRVGSGGLSNLTCLEN